VVPVRGSVHAAGFDLSASEPTTIPSGGKGVVKTGLAIAIPEGTYARIAPRSGLAAKKMIACGAGVVDYDYRGEVGVVLFNHGPEEFAVAAGDRVAQLILEECSMVGCVEVDSLDQTERGAGGFGSTGVSDKTPVAMEATAAPDAASKPPMVEVSSMQVKRTNPAAAMPVRGSVAAAGFDLAAAEANIVKAGGKAIIKTGLSIAIPQGTYARVAPRSGLAAKKMIQVGAGVIDYDYRGEVGVVLFNHGTDDFEVQVGDRVAQLILEKVAMSRAVEVESLDETERGAGGFGSTGMTEQVAVSTPPPKCPKAAQTTTPIKAAPGGDSLADVLRELQILRAEVEVLKGCKGHQIAATSLVRT